MAAASGRSDSALARQLFTEPYRFEFFQAVRLLERLFPTRQPVGRRGSPRDEVVRFRAHNALDFPPCDVYDLTAAGSDTPGPPQMTVTFMGLTGPQGALPQHYTELVMEHAAKFKPAGHGAAQHPLVDFLDIFNHRLISLFYRAWEKYRFPVDYERDGDDDFTRCLFALIGLGTGGLRRRFSFADESLLAYSGLLAQRPHSASAVAATLQDYFGVPVRIEQFVPQRFELDEGARTKLGAANSELGRSTIAGAQVWLHQAKFRVVFGPLGLEQFKTFLPVGPRAKACWLLKHYPYHPPRCSWLHEALRRGQAAPRLAELAAGRIFDWIPSAAGAASQPTIELTRLLAGPEYDFEIQPVLRAAETPATFLLLRGRQQPLLGWTSWLKTKPMTADADQVVLAVEQ